MKAKRMWASQWPRVLGLPNLNMWEWYQLVLQGMALSTPCLRLRTGRAAAGRG